jgi:hypothetical protein
MNSSIVDWLAAVDGFIPAVRRPADLLGIGDSGTKKALQRRGGVGPASYTKRTPQASTQFLLLSPNVEDARSGGLNDCGGCTESASAAMS